jgi:hypothetical protein
MSLRLCGCNRVGGEIRVSPRHAESGSRAGNDGLSAVDDGSWVNDANRTVMTTGSVITYPCHIGAVPPP